MGYAGNLAYGDNEQKRRWLKNKPSFLIKKIKLQSLT
jgi:hypothetical protein